MDEGNATQLLDAVHVGLQVWEATARDRGGLVLRWANAPAAASRELDRDGLIAGQVLCAALEQRPARFVAPAGPGWVEASLRPLGDRRVLLALADVTEARERERRLEASERLNAQIVSNLQEGVIVVDRHGRVTRANEAAARLCGISLGELTGLPLDELPLEVHHPDGTPAGLEDAPIRRALAGETVRGAVLAVRRRDGTEIWLESNSAPLAEADGTPFGALSTYVDVSERIHRERRMRQEADSDPLTGLANRRALERSLDAALARARGDAREVAVLMVDLDGFKALNDAHGHMAGDEALREVGRRLAGCVRERDVVARIGGDEFVLVLPDLHPGRRTAEECARRVRAALGGPIELDHASPRLGAATGVACFPRDGADGVALLAHADRAMYRAKR